MGGSDEKAEAPADAPAWQRANTTTTEAPESPADQKPTIEHARQFLRDEAVRGESREKKIEFLASKGFQEADILQLLSGDGEAEPEARGEAITTTSTTTTPPAAPAAQEAAPAAAPPGGPSPSEETGGHAPIITYPEFLTKPAKPPPLVTAAGLLSTLYAVAGLSTVAYGAARYVVSPMVDALAEARVDLHGAAARNLGALIEKLEGSVSEVPPPAATVRAAPGAEHGGDDAASSYDDPTELFHRDVGVQTSRPPSPSPWQGANGGENNGGDLSSSALAAAHADRLARLAGGARALAEGTAAQGEDLAALRAQLDALSGDLSQMRLQAQSAGFGVSYLTGRASGEPDDEIRRAKENIRRVKGVLLSARSFPASAR